jgi:serine phosphatase RsbU (regulator of sigma subunit)
MSLYLNVGDRLVIVSDGVAEATDVNGNLFGFEQVRDLLRGASTAAELAAAAQTFGQEDDISVIALTRTPIGKPVFA